MKKIHKVLVIFIVILLAAAFVTGGCFVMQSYYLASDFLGGTWINGQYCAGKSIEEVNAKFMEADRIQTVTVYDSEGNAYTLDAAAFGERPCEKFADETQYEYSYESLLQDISRTQRARSANNWLELFRKKEYTIAAAYNAPAKVEELMAYMSEVLPIFEDAVLAKQCSVKLLKEKEGFYLVDEKKHHLNAEKAALAIYHAVLTGIEEVNLEEAGCYENLSYTKEEIQIMEVWERINAFQTVPVTYLLGDERKTIDAAVKCNFIALANLSTNNREDESMIRDTAYEYTEADFLWDANGNVQVDENAIEEYIKTLAEEYDTLGKHTFQTTRGDIVTIEGGTYGNQLNQQAEIAYLKEACLQITPQTREPEYANKALHQGKNDIGDTYIEIDMGQQMMYFYKDGKQMIETPVVTGNTGRRMGTPARVCYVYAKQKNRVLRGPGYASRVTYWMPVNGNIGIHDASWRSEFGGEIYKTNGSHGCINTPIEAMTKLYENVEIGIPVIMFY
ncbi:MAG: L,D-transpeptidase family protein [Lachnospiraceae bacterium]|nr:L,D-transpeptidase family protein [Lachnospiraceae bacterium]